MASGIAAATILEAYEHWAPDYPPWPHNPLMQVEQRTMLRHWPQLAGRRALDLACGTGRYARMLSTQAREVVAVDFSPAMLDRVGGATRIRAEMSRLPFRSEAFDVVVCGLAVAHAPDIAAWMIEVARVLGPGGALLYSDFHPAAARAGMTRSFKDRSGRRWDVPHQNHEIDAQRRAAQAAGFVIEAVEEIRAGFELREAFAGSEAFYARWTGLPLALVVRAVKAARAAR